MKYEITHSTRYTYSDAVPVCHNIVHLEPRTVSNQSCSSFRMLVHPEPFDLRNGKDSFGNNETYFSIEQAHMGLTVTATSQVDVHQPALHADALPWESVARQFRTPEPDLLEFMPFVFPSMRTKPFPNLRAYAAESFDEKKSIIEATRELTSRIHADFQYDPRATTVSTPITEVFASRRGVCQDFAHLQLACLRSLGLAARYISGYLRTYPPPGKERLQGADASHAWVSVFCGEDAGWVDFDPTNDMIPSTDHITIAWGRDYADVCPIRGVILGGGIHEMSVSVDVAPVSETPE